jgi:hypothetical protein
VVDGVVPFLEPLQYLYVLLTKGFVYLYVFEEGASVVYNSGVVDIEEASDVALRCSSFYDDVREYFLGINERPFPVLAEQV